VDFDTGAAILLNKAQAEFLVCAPCHLDAQHSCDPPPPAPGTPMQSCCCAGPLFLRGRSHLAATPKGSPSASRLPLLPLAQGAQG
jgi:hypothetical protein